MKIKNKFIIPVIAVLVALFMTGVPVATVAADTEASDSTSETTTTNPAWTHTYTQTTLPYPTTSSLDEEINSAVSDILGETAGELGEPIRDAANTSGGFLRAIKAFIDKLIEFTKKIGDFLSGTTLRDILGSVTTTVPAEESTTAAQ